MNYIKEQQDIWSNYLSIPSGFADVKLGIRNLHPTQKAIVDSFFNPHKNTRTVARFGNGLGKTSVVAVIATLWSMAVLGAKVVYTSKTYRQISSQFIPAIKSYQHLFPRWDFLDDGIKINGIPRLITISNDNEAAYQGHHRTSDSPLLIIADEAAGLPDSTWYAIDRCSPNSLLILGSPLGTDNFFYEVETNPKFFDLFQHYKLVQSECDWIPKEQIDIMIQKWGRNHPLVQSSCFAEFVVDSEDQIISLDTYNKCLNNPPAFIPGRRGCGLDFAATGDSNVIVFVNGNKINIVKVWHEQDTMSAAAQFVVELNELKTKYGLTPGEVNSDASGMGLPICDRLRELGWPVNKFFGQSKPEDKDYKNRISEAWLELAKRIRNREIILPENTELRLQLLSRKQRLNSSGKMELQSKQEMKASGKASPDIVDALAMAISNPPGLVTYAQALPMSNNNSGKYVGLFS